MRLADFILAREEIILDEWESFARQLPVSLGMDKVALRDHARGILQAISHDLKEAQSDLQQADKSKGKAPADSQSQASLHGLSRVAEGFSVNQAMAEFRALRASVLRLWSEDVSHEADTAVDMTRFNEAIDQALTESLARYSDIKDRRLRLLDALLSSSPDLSYVLDVHCKIIYANKAFSMAIGRPAAEMPGADFCELCAPFAPDIGKNVQHVLDTATNFFGELQVTLPDGRAAYYEYLLVPVLDDKGRCEAVAGTGRDITDRKAAEERVRHSANYDCLTDLPNRSMFRERLDHEIKHAARTGLPLALLFIDLDGFKDVNDRLGHAAGDQLLQQVAARIRGCVRDTDTVARLGGDEFTVILTDVTVPTHVEALSRKILDCLSKPFILKTDKVTISGSVGIAPYPGGGASVDELVRHADAAMYVAKHGGRNRFHFYSGMVKAGPGAGMQGT